MLKQPWLEIAEYASLAGSALGIIAAATSSQVIYLCSSTSKAGSFAESGQSKTIPSTDTAAYNKRDR
jgi:hypothetical protein